MKILCYFGVLVLCMAVVATVVNTAHCKSWGKGLKNGDPVVFYACEWNIAGNGALIGLWRRP